MRRLGVLAVLAVWAGFIETSGAAEVLPAKATTKPVITLRIVGSSVKNHRGEYLGRIDDIIVNPQTSHTELAMLLLDYPRNTTRVTAVPWPLLTYVSDQGQTGDAKKAIYDILPKGPDVVLEAAGPIEAVRLMVSLLRRGTRWNVFGITTHEKFELDGGLMHFLEARMDASFGTTPLAMERAILLMERGLVNPEKVISHRFALKDITKAVETMAGRQRNKVIINP